ncbi:MAG: TRAP transporter substrate-binding protein [Alphaproteobacteria bacterium]|nr:TRAP transporter substrate-binding protein [Alphaproteobacteria bacterium]MCB9931406.1 TRAP transporter substrate-binding protein [Alphaproteobacteria bacterium]
MPLSRRDFLRITKDYGTKTAMFAAITGTTAGTVLGQFAARDAHAAKRAKYKFRYGPSVMTPKSDGYLQIRVYDFANWIEELSDGEIAVQIIDKGQACAENQCVERVGAGVLDIGGSSAQNAAAVVYHAQALDWPFLWRDRTSLVNLLHDPSMNAVYRDVWKKKYGIEFLYCSNEMRDVFMGLKYSDLPEVRHPDQLKGRKLRITNSAMIQNFAASLGMSPVPLAWTETLEGMKSGVVDGMETWGSSAAGFGMTRVTAQAVELDFCPGMGSTFINSRSMERLPERLQEVVREAARRASELSEEKVGWGLDAITGCGPNPAPDSDYVKMSATMRHVRLTEDEMDTFRERGSVERNGQIYSEIRKELDALAGLDVFGAVSEYEKKVRGKPLNAQKWWA